MSVKKGREGELTCRPRCSCKRPGRGRTCQRNPFCPICSHRTASTLIPNMQQHKWRDTFNQTAHIKLISF